jgi:KDO2-lipid IV(A) lauroyltransferase
MLDRLVVLPLLRALNRLAGDTAGRVGGGLGVLAFHLGVRRRVASAVFRTAGLAHHATRRRDLIRRSYATMGANFLELWTVGGPDGPERHIRTLAPAWHALAHRRHPGCAFLTPHLGNWDMGAAGVRQFVPRFLAYAKAQHNPAVDRLVNAQRERSGITVLLAEHGDRSSAVQVMRALRQGTPVGLMADQAPGSREGVPARFFGVATYCHGGPGFFASRARVPIIPGLCLRVHAGRSVLFMGRPLAYDSGDEAALVQASQDLLATMIAAFPGQYFWQHRRFKDLLELPPRSVEPWRRWGLRLLVEPTLAVPPQDAPAVMLDSTPRNRRAGT